MYFLDCKLDELISKKYDDISNMVQLTYGVKYDGIMIQSILNLLKSDNTSLNLFSSHNVDKIINNYSEDHHFLTMASLHTIKPFTLSCLHCHLPLKLQFKEKVNVFLMDHIDNGVIFIARCCHIEYHTNSYIKGSKRYVNRQSLYNQKYIYFGGKCVLYIDVLLRYVSDLINMYAGFENFCGAYNDTITSVLLQHARDNDLKMKDPPVLERRLFENIWLIYSTSILKFFLSTSTEIDIPYHISNHDERNLFFASQLPQLERDFIVYWSSHMLKFECDSQCCKAIVIDGFQKPNRFICGFMQELIHSEELGDIEWGCGFRPEMIPDKQNPGYWKNTKYCPKHIDLEYTQSVRCSTDKDDYNVGDCNVSRTDRYYTRQTSYGVVHTMYNCGIIVNFNELYRSESPTRVLHRLFTTIDCVSSSVPLPKYLIYDNACGLLLTFRHRLEHGQIHRTTRTDVL
ncbi:hypothetical protein I4U23_004309 [Adineta vaga]|nr:hypothetical protein I4U23_004309 [Adineta vaga]